MSAIAGVGSMSVDVGRETEIWADGTSYSTEEIDLAYRDYVDECEHDGLEPLAFAKWAENFFDTPPTQPYHPR
jgi:hypothetical protein